MVMVDVVAEVTPREIEAPPAPDAETPPVVARRITRIPIVAPAKPRSVDVSASRIAAADMPDRTVAPAAPDRTAGDGPTVLVATASTGLTGSTRGTTTGSGHAEPRGHAAYPDNAQRSALVGRYRDVLRNRIRDGFRYPAEARELELVGQVVVQVTVDRVGRVLLARLRGSCPHPILCDDALRTIRAAAPFSPVPAELGQSVQIEVPLNYAFE